MTEFKHIPQLKLLQLSEFKLPEFKPVELKFTALNPAAFIIPGLDIEKMNIEANRQRNEWIQHIEAQSRRCGYLSCQYPPEIARCTRELEEREREYEAKQRAEEVKIERERSMRTSFAVQLQFLLMEDLRMYARQRYVHWALYEGTVLPVELINMIISYDKIEAASDQPKEEILLTPMLEMLFPFPPGCEPIFRERSDVQMSFEKGRMWKETKIGYPLKNWVKVYQDAAEVNKNVRHPKFKVHSCVMPFMHSLTVGSAISRDPYVSPQYPITFWRPPTKPVAKRVGVGNDNKNDHRRSAASHSAA